MKRCRASFQECSGGWSGRGCRDNKSTHALAVQPKEIDQLSTLIIEGNFVSRFAQPLTQLIDELSKLPGIGRKSAQRLAFHILRATEQDAFALADAIRDLKAQLHLCSICHNITDVDPCQFCSNPSRNQAIICVVEEPSNIASI